MITIIDYGMGNIHSVKKALEAKNAKVIVSDSPSQIKKSDKVVLPGVGAFGDAVRELERLKMFSAIKEYISDKKIFLGICLGMHLLFESSEEDLKAKGLGVLEGRVKKFIPGNGLKVPHMGWNQIKIKRTDCPLLKGLKEDPSVYFCHSYFAEVTDNRIAAALTEYGAEFPSIIWKENIFAMQFHPEKSQDVGLKIIENFVNL